VDAEVQAIPCIEVAGGLRGAPNGLIQAHNIEAKYEYEESEGQRGSDERASDESPGVPGRRARVAFPTCRKAAIADRLSV
jgi:hypothetical protein